MKTFESEGVVIEIPDIEVFESGYTPRMRIIEGEYVGTEFTISNIRMDDKDEGLMWYDLDTVPKTAADKIKPIVDNFILYTLIMQIEREKEQNENKATE